MEPFVQVVPSALSMVGWPVLVVYGALSVTVLLLASLAGRRGRVWASVIAAVALFAPAATLAVSARDVVLPLEAVALCIPWALLVAAAGAWLGLLVQRAQKTDQVSGLVFGAPLALLTALIGPTVLWAVGWALTG